MKKLWITFGVLSLLLVGCFVYLLAFTPEKVVEMKTIPAEIIKFKVMHG
jgi:hypothetical protein